MRGLQVKRLSSFVTFAAVALLAPATPVAAQALVLKSDVAAARVDRVLPQGRNVRVPANRTLVVMLPGGETRTVAGPETFAVPRAEPAQRDLFAALREMLQVRRDRLRLGGVRGGDAGCGVEPEGWPAVADQWRLGCRVEALTALDARLAALGR